MLRLGRSRKRGKGKGEGQGKAAKGNGKVTQHCRCFPDDRCGCWPNPKAGIKAIQTFSLAIGGEGIIQSLLLDRFLACMKPASKT
jgi:hypothetical protein